MRVWCDVYDTDGTTRLGEGPIVNVRSASVTRALDGAGSVSFTVPGTDERSLELATNKKRVTVNVFNDRQGEARVLGRGVIESLRANRAGSAWSLTVQGPDDLSALKYKNTLLARLYSNVTIAYLVESLAALAGWTVDSSGLTDLVSARFDGDSVLKALQYVVQQQGLHLRLGDDLNTVEIGAFGDDSGLRCVNPQTVPIEMYENDDVTLIDSISVVEDSKDIVNWLIPVGAGEGEAMLTLQYSTRTGPYTIKTMSGPDGRVLYYLSDTDSIDTYGQIEKVGTFKNIAPLSNSDADLINASNALYDAAAAWLDRHKDKYDVYALSVRKVAKTVKPGQKIHVRFKGVIEQGNQLFTYRDINQDMWIIECTERIGVEGMALDLKVATVDRYEQDAVNIILGALDAIELRNIRVQPYPSTRSYVFDREIAPSFPAQVPVRITDSTLTLQRCQIRIKTSPFRATSSTALSGGGVTSNSGGGSATSSDNAGAGNSGFTGNADGTVGFHNHFYVMFDHQHNVNIPAHQHTNPTHTHTLNFVISDDVATPIGISIYVDGINRTTELGGPFAPAGGNQTIDLDPGLITGYLVNASGGLRQEHTIEIRCASGQGRVEVQTELYETIQSVAIS